MPKITLINSIDDSRFPQVKKLKCQNDNHDPNDNPVQEVSLVLEWNDTRRKFLDVNPEYWCQDCIAEDCDYIG